MGLSEALKKWSSQVLQEFDLSDMDIHSATTDGAPDIKFTFIDRMDVDKDYLLFHLLNFALVKSV